MPPKFSSPILKLDHMGSPLIRTSSSPSPANGVGPGSTTTQLSTPPGPPVFTSPVRPAAFPFRSSPSTPLPVEFSSSELQHQVLDTMEEMMPSGKSLYVLFTANKILKQKKHANLPSLTFGALVSPGREISAGPQILQRDPHRCQNCGAYANFYCNILAGSGQWQCVICRKLMLVEGNIFLPVRKILGILRNLHRRWLIMCKLGTRGLVFYPLQIQGCLLPLFL